MSLAWLLNTAWMLAGQREYRAFRRAVHEVAGTQARLLATLLRRQRASWFGQRHRFARLRTPRDYQQAVPVMQASELQAAVARIAHGEAGVLTAEPVLLLEPTSGTTGAENLVPYTESLRREFQRAVAVWISDLFRRRPAVRRGRAYWSLSPALPRRRSPAGVPIGFDEDVSYLGRWEQWMVRRLLITPAAEMRSAPLEVFRQATRAALWAAADLALISVWSPTFLLALLEGETPESLAGRWPRLALISCWTDAAAARPARQLQALFPGVEIQPKGLVATEGVVSFPLVGRPGAVLAVRSHFFEFEESGGTFRLAHQLDRGGRYRVLLTTGGGLYRYALGDEVEVVGFEGGCPLLRFLGKGDRVSDRVGEKLAEPFVRAVLDRVLAAHALEPAFALLAPREGRPDRYVLYLQGGEPDHTRLAADLQAALEANPHYAYACGVGQLAPVEVCPLGMERGPAWRLYEARCLARGQKAGDIKPAALDAWTGWAEVFAVSF